MRHQETCANGKDVQSFDRTNGHCSQYLSMQCALYIDGNVVEN